MQHMPNVEADIPLPASATEAMPPLSPKEELEMRARTVKMIADLNGTPIEPTPEHKGQARELMEKVVANKTDPALANYPNETIAYLAGMVAEYDHMIVRELADLKIYVVNKLVAETANPNSPVRLGAIKALGDVDGVDAFKKRSEVTHKQASLEEVEKELLETLDKLEKRTIDVQTRVISSEDHA
jgi:hypothetical protein